MTGGAKRVGRAISLALARAGADVAVHHRTSTSEAAELCTSISDLGRRAPMVQADLRDPGQTRAMVDQALEELGGLDILVNNAASFAEAAFLDSSDQQWEQAWSLSLEINLVAPARMARLCAPFLRASRGVIINLHDIAGEYVWPGHLQHGAAKAGLKHLSASLAAVLGPEIRVNGVMPGIAIFPAGASKAEQDRQIANTLLHRPGTAEDIADAVVFIAGADYMTGAHLAVDGGWSVHGDRD
ncbi:MAG: SDR family oxidoreductase [Deltaproteobacteria bacterium]|nr:SDR family oxidoreductase [Deltaproteobacteria bacterium]